MLQAFGLTRLPRYWRVRLSPTFTAEVTGADAEGAYDAVADAIEQAPAHAPVPVNINWDGSEPHEAVDGDIDHPAIARDRVGPGHPT